MGGSESSYKHHGSWNLLCEMVQKCLFSRRECCLFCSTSTKTVHAVEGSSGFPLGGLHVAPTLPPARLRCLGFALPLLQVCIVQKQNADETNSRLFELKASSRLESPFIGLVNRAPCWADRSGLERSALTRLRPSSDVSRFPPRRREQTSCTFLESCLRPALNLPA